MQYSLLTMYRLHACACLMHSGQTGMLCACAQGRHRPYLNRGRVCTNWPSMVGRRGLAENTGASMVSPSGDQKPLVSQSVKGHSMPSSRTKAKMLWYCGQVQPYQQSLICEAWGCRPSCKVA